MKQQFLIVRGDSKTDLLIREFAELEKNETSLVCENGFKVGDLKKAAQRGINEVISQLRTKDFFPPTFLAEKLAQGIMELLGDAGKESVEVMVDDVTIMKDREADFVEEELVADDDEDIDELLEDDEIPFEDESDEEEEEDPS